jgi:hypothetical protein
MYTEDDLVKIEQAITKLQMGERVVSVKLTQLLR